MQKMKAINLEIEGMKLIDAFVAEDIRGAFIKDYSEQIFKELGINHMLKETFYTRSYKGVIRAIHFQRVKQQSKLVRCIKGRIYDICVDLRRESKTFGQWIGIYLDDRDNKEVLIPEGCGHGYLVLEDSIVSYKCAEVFYGEYDDGIIWNDKDIAIKWPLDQVDEIILSDKDKSLMTYAEFIKKYGGF